MLPQFSTVLITKKVHVHLLPIYEDATIHIHPEIILLYIIIFIFHHVKIAKYFSAKFWDDNFYEDCNCAEKCINSHYHISISQAAFPAQYILNDVQETFGFSEKDVRSVKPTL